MSEDIDNLDPRAASGALEAMYSTLAKNSWRWMSCHPQTGLDMRRVAFVSNLVNDQITNPYQGRFEYNKNVIKRLINHPAISLHDTEDPNRISANSWDGSKFTKAFSQNLMALRIYEKRAPHLARDVHIHLVEYALNLTVTGPWNNYNSVIIEKIIEKSFATAVEFINENLIIEAFRKCIHRSKFFDPSAHHFIGIWHQLYTHFPKRQLNNFFWNRNPDQLYTVREIGSALYRNWGFGDNFKCTLFSNNPEVYIFVFFVNDANPFYGDNSTFEHRLAVIKFLASIDTRDLHLVNHHRENAIQRFPGTIRAILNDDNDDRVIRMHAKKLLLNLCFYCDDRGLRGHVKWVLRQIAEFSHNNNLEMLAWQLAMDNEFEGDLIRNIDLSTIRPYCRNPAESFDLCVFASKFKEPRPHNLGHVLTWMLAYGRESIDIPKEQQMSIKQCQELSQMFMLDFECEKGAILNEEPFGGVHWDWESLPKLFNLVAALNLAILSKHHEEFGLPEGRRHILCDEKGTFAFENSWNFSLSVIVELLTFAKNNLTMFVAFEFRSEASENIRRLRSCLSKELDFLRGFARDVVRSVTDHIQGNNKDLLNILTPLVDMFCYSMEAQKLMKIYDDMFFHFFVPAVKALLLIAPLLAIRMIVAFCRCDLRLNLRGRYDHIQRAQEDWDRRRSQKTEEISREHFETFRCSVPDILGGRTNDYQQPDLHDFMLEDEVAAVVKDRDLYTSREVLDYLVVLEYYKIIGEVGKSRHQWQTMPADKGREILFD